MGYQCVDCVAQGRRTQRVGVTVVGAKVTSRPIVVPLLIALNVAVFVVTAVQAGSLSNNQSSPLFDRWALWPPVVASGEWWRLFTSGFLHYGPLHILFNMVALWVLGRDMELVLGRIRFVAVYFLATLGGGTLVYLVGDVRTAAAGASGAVFGLIGGLAVLCYRLKLDPRNLIILLVINGGISLLPGISLLDHLAGFVIGLLATAGLVYAPAGNRIRWQVGVLLFLAAALLGLILLRNGQLGSVVCTYSPGLSCSQPL